MATLIDGSGNEIGWGNAVNPPGGSQSTTGHYTGYTPEESNKYALGGNQQVGTAYPQTGKSTYKLSDDQYSKLGQDAWKLGNSDDWYSKGWMNIGDHGGDANSPYQFAYDDAQNIGQADAGDTSRWLYVRDMNDPTKTQRYSLGDALDPNIDMTKLGESLYGGGENWLDDFWGNFYEWTPQAVPPPAGTTPPAVTPPPAGTTPPPQGLQPDQGGIGQPGGGYRVPGPGNPSALTPEDAISIGLGGARDAYENMLNQPQYYPGWWGQDYQSLDPSKYTNQYPEFLDVPTYGGITMPGAYTPSNVTPGPYQGLMEGDYDRLETALRQPGETAAQRAFEQGGNYLKDIMGSSGMYGSSVMGRQANEGLSRPYMDTLASNASNAVAQRYGLQQGDLQFGSNFDLQRAAQQIQDNQFGASYGLNLADLMQQDTLNKYKSELTGRNLLNDYNNQKFQFGYGLDEAARGEYNNLLQNRFQYDLASQDWRNALNERYMNAGLALAGQGAPLQQANWNYQQQQQAYNDNQLGSQIGMGLDIFDRVGGWDWAKQGANSIWDSVTGWFG